MPDGWFIEVWIDGNLEIMEIESTASNYFNVPRCAGTHTIEVKIFDWGLNLVRTVQGTSVTITGPDEEPEASIFSDIVFLVGLVSVVSVISAIRFKNKSKIEPAQR
ncbi:MAG: hypothetical protein ACTSYF_00070 [Promethearchaeota archaeon]